MQYCFITKIFGIKIQITNKLENFHDIIKYIIYYSIS